MSEDATSGAGGLAQELAVPAVMLAVIGLIAADTRQLSFEASIFPFGLIAVTLAALGAAVWATVVRRRAPPRRGEDGDDMDAAGPILAVRPWLLVAAPGVAFALIGVVGVPVALVLAAGLVQRALGERSLVRNALLPLAVVAPTYLLFKHVLFVRFPPNLLGL